MLFHPAARLAQAIARSPVPVDIIVRCLWRGQPRPSGNGMGVRTVGLDDFGLPEIDHPPTGEEPTTIYNRTMNVSTYLMEHGSVLKDGDTIGTDSSAIMRVRHKQAADGRLALVLERNAELT